MTQLETLTAVAAILVGAERALSKGIIGPTLTPKWRAAALALVTVAIAVVNGVAAGNAWGTAALAALATTGTALVLALAEAGSEWVRWSWPSMSPSPRPIACVSRTTRPEVEIDPPSLPPAAALLLVAFAFGGQACGVVSPSVVPTSPCPGMICEDVTVANSVILSLCARSAAELRVAKAQYQRTGSVPAGALLSARKQEK